MDDELAGALLGDDHPVDSAPDPDWYFDHVLVDAAPGIPERLQRGPAAQWRRWWRRESDRLGTETASRAACDAGFVLTRGTARDCGLSEADIRRLVRGGTWSVPARGVLSPVVIPGPAPEDHASVMLAARRRHALIAAAATTSRVGHTASDRSAAILHGLPTFAIPAMPELTAAPTATAGRHRQALVRSGGLLPDELTTWFGIPVTSVPRTLVDLARHDRRDGIMAADAALREGLVAPRDISTAISNASGWPGVRTARAVLALASPLAESPLESMVRLALHDDGFPPPVLQAQVGGYRVDMLWPERRLVLEADGRVKYTRDELWQEKMREHRLAQLGFTVLRVVWSDVTRDWAQTGERLRAALFLPVGTR